MRSGICHSATHLAYPMNTKKLDCLQANAPKVKKAAVIHTMLLRRVNVVKKRFRYVDSAMSYSIVHFKTKLLSMFACLLSLESRVTNFVTL